MRVSNRHAHTNTPFLQFHSNVYLNYAFVKFSVHGHHGSRGARGARAEEIADFYRINYHIKYPDSDQPHAQAQPPKLSRDMNVPYRPGEAEPEGVVR